jgi:TP901 family phage tail tape measure protein
VGLGAEAFTVLAILEARDRASEVFAKIDESLGRFSETAKSAAESAGAAGEEIDTGLGKAAPGADKLAAAQQRAAAAARELAEAQGELRDAGAAAGAGDADAAAQERLAAAEQRAAAAATEEVTAQEALGGAMLASAGKAGVYADAQGRLRDASGRFVAGEQEVTAAADESAAAQERAGAAASAAGDAQAGAGAKGGAAAAGGLGKYKMAVLGIAVGAGLAVKGAMDFQAQTTRLVTSANESAARLGMVRQGMLSISAATATSTSQMASGMYTVESAGYHGAAALTVLKAAAQGAKDENADLATVANAVTDVLVDYHLKAGASANVTSQLVKAVSFGKVSFQEFSGSMSTILPLASAIHLKFADVSGVLAEMTSHGITARQASQQEANAMRELVKPNAAMVREYTALGITSDQVYRKLGSAGLGGTMQWLSGIARNGAGAIGQNYTQALGKMMGSAAGLQVALATTGENAQGTRNAIAGIAGASADAKGNVDGFARVQGTLAFKMGAAKQSVAAMGISLGSALLPAVTAIMGPITSMLQLIASNKAAADAFALVVGGVLAGALGKKLKGAFKDVEGAVRGAGKGIEWLTGKMTAQAAAAKKTAETSEKASADSAAAAESGAAKQEAASGEAAAAAEADAAETAAANEAAAGESSGSWIASAASTVAGWAAAGVRMAAQAAVWVASSAVKVGAVVAENVIGAATTAAAWVAANAVMLLGIGLVIAAVVIAVVEIVRHWHTIVDGVKEAWNAVYDFISGIISDVISFVKAHWALIVGIITGPLGLAAAMIVKHWTQIKSFVSGAVNDVINFVKSHWRLIVSILGGPLGLAVALVTKYWNDIKHWFAEGTAKVLSILRGLQHEVYSAGADIVRGIWNGISGMGGWLWGKVRSFASNTLHTFESALGIGSPSKYTTVHGQMLGAGLAGGIIASIPKAAGAAHQMSASVLSATSGLSARGGSAGTGSPLALSAAGPAGGAGGGGAPVIHVHVTGNTVIGDSDINKLVDKIGRKLATVRLPASGTKINIR